MSLYLGTTEITKLRDLAPQTGLDITDLWFGSTNVYTVWQVYEGTLPATINANGDNIKQYQVWGNVGGVGDKTVNLLSFDALKDAPSGSFTSTGAEFTHMLNIYGKPNTQYTMCSDGAGSTSGGSDANRSLYFNGPTSSDCVFVDNPVTKTSDEEGLIKIGFLSERTNAQQYINGTAHVWLVEGTTPPEAFVPYGYEVDMDVKSGNLLCATATDTVAGNEVSISTIKNSSDFTINAATTGYRSITVPLNITLSAGTYTLSVYGLHIVTDTFDRCNIRDTGGNYYGTSLTTPASPKTFSIQESITISRLSFVIYQGEVYDNEKIGVCLVRGAVAPTKYQPHYNTTPPIYIGDDPLGKDEYIDYQARKVYRMINGVLTPIDPPVPLPALPTVEGATIVDYTGSGTAPEKVLLKYRKEGF